MFEETENPAPREETPVLTLEEPMAPTPADDLPPIEPEIPTGPEAPAVEPEAPEATGKKRKKEKTPKVRQKKERSHAYWLILLAAAVIFTVMSSADKIWADEAYTFAMVRHSFKDIWRITAADVHPPLYYFLARLFGTPFGWSQFSLRFFSALCYLLIMAIGGWQLKKLFNRKIALIFMVLFPLYPFALEHAVEARMYAFGALAVFLNALCAYRIWVKEKFYDWFGFTIAGVCAAYTHYFSLVSAGVIYGLLLLLIILKKRKLFWWWFGAAAVTIALYLPWLACFIQQLLFKVSNEYWIEPITLSTLFDYALALLHANGHSAFPAFLGLVMAAILVIGLLRKDWLPLLTLAVPAVTLLLGVVVSLLVRPIFIIRYLAPCAPLLMFFLAYGLGSMKRETLCTAAMGVLIVSFSGNFLFAALDLLPQKGEIRPKFNADTAGAQACVVIDSDSLHTSQVLSFYKPTTPIYTTETLGAASPFPNMDSLTEFASEKLETYLVVTDEGSGPDRMFTEGFNAELLGTFRKNYSSMDIWMLTRQTSEESSEEAVEEVPVETIPEMTEEAELQETTETAEAA